MRIIIDQKFVQADIFIKDLNIDRKLEQTLVNAVTGFMFVFDTIISYVDEKSMGFKQPSNSILASLLIVVNNNLQNLTQGLITRMDELDEDVKKGKAPLN